MSCRFHFGLVHRAAQATRPGNPNLPTPCAMESFAFRAAGSVERELADGVKVQKGKMETDDLWVQLKRQTEEMENRIRRLAGCDRQQSVTAEEPIFEKKEVADSVEVRSEASAYRKSVSQTHRSGGWTLMTCRFLFGLVAARLLMRMVSCVSLLQAVATPSKVWKSLNLWVRQMRRRHQETTR